ncbi:MAG: DNA methyltransferase [Bacteroidota bacterium]
MPLSWNEIKTRAAAFVHEYRDETREHAEAKTFWDAFFNVFGVSRRKVASFEEAVKKASGRQGFIDLFWPGVLIAEHKSRGRDLDAAYGQALDYFPGLDDAALPRYVVVSDFERLRLNDLDTGDAVEFALLDLLDHIERFGFIAGYEKRSYDEQDPVNVRAAAKMGDLHDRLKDAGYTGHDLEVVLVRLLFCLFADDTGIFTPRGLFEDYLLTRTAEDGSDLGGKLTVLFEVLNTPPEDRQRTLDEQLAAFPYVNGALFAERLRTAHFNADLRTQLLDACALDWGAISPAIFGAMFQSAMDAEARRELGAHYTSEQNILKLIGPLFMDGLRADFERARARNSRPELDRFHRRLADLRLLDPACGCGNFLVIAYRELRRLEIEVIRELYRRDLERGQRVTNIADVLRVNVDQCFGIEIEEFPAQIAQVALWLMDHQMNTEVSTALGEYFTRLPLRRAAHIRHGNALTFDWAACFGDDQPPTFDYILGNPPFVGKKEQTTAQKQDLRAVMHGVRGAGVLDFVTGWYIRSAQYMQAHPETATAFVSTNSISQGEQVGILWNELFTTYGASIHFAHRTFQWSNEAPGKAAVHCVIVGFALVEAPGRRRLFEYNDVRDEPHEVKVANINPYLVDAPNVVVLKRSKPVSADAPPMSYGSMPIDSGNLILSPEEADEILQKHPEAAPFIRPYFGGNEFLNSDARYCLWLVDIPPAVLRALPPILERVEANRVYRLSSGRAATNKLAATPTLFGEIRQPDTRFLLVPKVSSENRDYMPVGYFEAENIASGSALIIPDADGYHVGVLSSTMHMAWMRYVAGRMKSDYQYSARIVYNNFPWPEATAKQRTQVEAAAEAVLDARAPHLDAGATLADLYDPLAMPPALTKAHNTLDRAVDRAYRPQPFTSEANRVAFLFERYEALTNALFAEQPKRTKKRRR